MAMFDQLKKEFSGELYVDHTGLDEAMRTIYSTDASEYQERPMGVAIPQSTKDLQTLIRWAADHRKTLIPRAAGTSLAGQVVGNGMVVDISKHFSSILELNVDEKWVRVQPGVIRDDLNAYLKPFGLMYGPETSTSSRAMIGGMIGNNSCGLHSIVWGCTRDHLLEVKALLDDGSEVAFKKTNRDEWLRKSKLENSEGRIYQELGLLIGDVQNRNIIAAAYPHAAIHRRNTGYALDRLCEDMEKKQDLNIAALIAGSEGTLCIVTEAKLALINLPPTNKAVVAVHTQSINESLLVNLIALEHRCFASELVDDFILGFTEDHPEFSTKRSFVEGKPKAILMVEFFHEDAEALTNQCRDFVENLKSSGLGYAYPILLNDQTDQAWNLRKAGLGLLRNLPGDARPVNLIEDCAVTPQDLPSYIAEVEELLKSKNLQYSMYAHAGAGEIHVEPIINLKTPEGKQQFREVLQSTAALVKKYRGSLSGEHGDGRLRGEFIPYVLGEEAYGLIRDVKKIFDPSCLFNFGKVVDAPPMDSHLRNDAKPSAHPIPTYFDYGATGSLLHLTEKCSGSGDCRKTEVTGGTMCPSFMATRNEKDTTRARANVLRQYLTEPIDHTTADEEVKHIMDLCLSCKACIKECPTQVDVSKMKAEFMQAYHDKNGIPLRTRLIAGFSKQMHMASSIPRIYNAIAGNSTLRKWMNKSIGFHPDRSMPKLGDTTLRKWIKNRKGQSLSTDKKLYLFVDEFTNYIDVEKGKKMILLMERLGYQVHVIDHPDSARSQLSKGILKAAKAIANQQVNLFASLIKDDVPLVGIEPSAILGFRDEFPGLVDSSIQQHALALAKNVYLFEEWFMREADAGRIQKDSFTKNSKSIRIHGHCHQKALASMVSTKRALSFPEQYEARLIPSGCCGMAGSFGYEKEHYDISMKIGELVLFKKVRELNEEDILVASGTSCRHQILDGTGRKSYHPAEVLYDALV